MESRRLRIVDSRHHPHRGGLGGLVGESVCEVPPDDFMRCAMEDFLGVSLGALTGFFVGVFIVQVLYALSHDE